MPTSTAYSVQHDLQPRQSTPVGYIPGLDPPPHLPAPLLDLVPPVENTLSSAALPNPSTITPEMAAILLKQIQESNPQLLSSLGLVPANQIQTSDKKAIEVPRIPAPPSASTVPKRNGSNSFHSNGVAAAAASTSTDINENGWSQIDKRHSINGGDNNHAINLISQQRQPTSSSSSSTTANATGTTGHENNKENSQEPIWVMRFGFQFFGSIAK